MISLPRSIVWRMFLRSFAIQGSWNYRTLQGAGFAYALMPLLRWVYGRDEARLQQAVERHTTLFNAHPYLAGMALGAVARMEADAEDPALIERFKTALRGSLGTLGDRIVWAGWRPACVLLGIFVLLVTNSAGAAVGVFLVVYNAGHLTLRWWALRVGIEHGRYVGDRLTRDPLRRSHELVIAAAAFLIGAVLPFVVSGALTGSRLAAGWLAVPVVAVFVGWRMGSSARVPAIVVLAAAAAAGFLFRLSP